MDWPAPPPNQAPLVRLCRDRTHTNKSPCSLARYRFPRTSTSSSAPSLPFQPRLPWHPRSCSNDPMSRKLAFIGLGSMGGPMAGHLLAAGHSLTLHTRTQSRAQDLLGRGAVWADSPADAARRADVVFICVPD